MVRCLVLVLMVPLVATSCLEVPRAAFDASAGSDGDARDGRQVVDGGGGGAVDAATCLPSSSTTPSIDTLSDDFGILSRGRWQQNGAADCSFTADGGRLHIHGETIGGCYLQSVERYNLSCGAVSVLADIGTAAATLRISTPKDALSYEIRRSSTIKCTSCVVATCADSGTTPFDPSEHRYWRLLSREDGLLAETRGDLDADWTVLCGFPGATPDVLTDVGVDLTSPATVVRDVYFDDLNL